MNDAFPHYHPQKKNAHTHTHTSKFGPSSEVRRRRCYCFAHLVLREENRKHRKCQGTRQYILRSMPLRGSRSLPPRSWSDNKREREIHNLLSISSKTHVSLCQMYSGRSRFSRVLSFSIVLFVILYAFLLGYTLKFSRNMDSFAEAAVCRFIPVFPY